MVSFPKTGPYPEKEIPFAEFDAYYRSMAYPTGVIRYSLHIGHRYTPISFSIMNPTVDLLRVFSEWEQVATIYGCISASSRHSRTGTGPSPRPYDQSLGHRTWP